MRIPEVSRSLSQFPKILTFTLKPGAQNYFFVNAGFQFTSNALPLPHYKTQACVSKK